MLRLKVDAEHVIGLSNRLSGDWCGSSLKMYSAAAVPNALAVRSWSRASWIHWNCHEAVNARIRSRLVGCASRLVRWRTVEVCCVQVFSQTPTRLMQHLCVTGNVDMCF